MSSYFRYPVEYGGSYTLTKDDSVYIVTSNGATITLPNPQDASLLGKLFIIKTAIDLYTTPININVASGSGNNLIDNSFASIQISEGYGALSFICSNSPNGNTWFAISKLSNI